MDKLAPIIEVLSPSPKKRGRKPGSGKVPGSGRKVGSGNKVVADVREMILARGKPIELLCDISRGVKIRIGPQAGPGEPQYAYPSLQERAAAAKILLDKIVSAPPVASPEVHTAPTAPEMTNLELAQMILFTLTEAQEEIGTTLEHVRTPMKAEPAPQPDPFAAERAEQAAKIAAATAEPTAPEASEYDRAVAAQLAERAAALAECRPERPAPVWYDHGRSLRAGEDYTPRSQAPNYRHRPR